MYLATTNTLRAKAGTANVITFTIFGDEVSAGVDAYSPIAQGQLANTTTTIYTAPSSTQAIITEIQLANTSASPVTGVTFYLNGTAATNQLNGGFTIPANGSAVYRKDNGITIYDSAGASVAQLIVLTGDVTGSGSGSIATTLATVNASPGTTGSASKTTTVTTNGKGLVTANTEQNIAITESQVNNLVSDLALKAPLASPALTNSPTAPTPIAGDSSTLIATTQFVQTAVLQSPAKEAVKYATTGVLPSVVYANGSSGVGATLTGVAFGAISTDSSSPSVGDRIMVRLQASNFQNGFYNVTATGSGIAVFVLTRTTDFDQSTDIKTGDSVLVTAGSTLAGTTWDVNSADNPVMGTDPITFAQTGGPGSVTGGNGITVTGSSVAIDTSVTVDKNTAQVLTNKTLANDTAAAGDIIFSNIAAPATPAAGKTTQYVDSTSKNMASKNDAGTVNHGIQTRTATASNWIRSIADDGSTTISQPVAADVTGAVSTARLINTTAPLTGGGDLSADRTLAISAATTSTAGSQSATDKAKQDNWSKAEVNVLDFGADNTGTNDVSTALTNAIAALPNGGVVLFPAGQYKLTAAFTIATAHITFRGTTKYNSVIVTTSTTADILVLNQYYITIEDLGFQGTIASAQVTSRSAGFAINANGGSGAYAIIRRCSFTYQWDCINLANQLAVIDDCEMRYYAHSNIVVNHNSDHQIHKIVSDNNAGALPTGSGIDVQVTASLIFSDCNIIHANFALNINPAVGVTIPSVKGNNSFFDTSAVGCRMASAGAWFRSEFTNCWFSSMSTAGILLSPSTAGTNVDGITWVNCDIYNNVGGTTNGFQTTTGNVGKWKMVGCSIAGWTNGINLVAGAAHYPTILCNTIGSVSAFGVNTTGITIGAGAYKGLVIMGNDCNDNTTVLTLGAATFTANANFRIIDNPGINPRGAVTTPGAPASTVVVTNTTGFRVFVRVKWGATTAPTVVAVNGVSVAVPAAAAADSFVLEPGGTFNYTGTVAMASWVWVGM